MMFRRSLPALPTLPAVPGALTPSLPSRRPHLPSRLPRVLLLAAAGLLAGSGVAQAASPVGGISSTAEALFPAVGAGTRVTGAPSASAADATSPSPGAISPAARTASLSDGGLSPAAGAAPNSSLAIAPGGPNAPQSDPACTPGEFCLWSQESYTGDTQHFDLRAANPGECIPLPEGFESHSFVNRMTRDVTIYQGEDCSTEGDFHTYPGGGTYVPQSPFVVRAIQIWD